MPTDTFYRLVVIGALARSLLCKPKEELATQIAYASIIGVGWFGAELGMRISESLK